MNTNIKYVIGMVILLFISAINLSAETLQGGTIKGTVYDQDNAPIIGATVIIKGTSQGTVTDVDGNFTLPPQSSPVTIQISYLGFEAFETKADGKTPLVVRMKETNRSLDEVVVIGYGSTTKKEITGSVSSLKETDFNKGSYSDPMGLIQGKVAGLSILKKDGANPQGGYEIILRGTNTLSSEQGPLIIIDGVIGADLRSVNYEEIESMDILKDGSAAAIYGTQGTNGVIIITTKKAKSGKTSLEYNGQFTVQTNVRRVESLNANEFVDAIQTYNPDKIGSLYGYQTNWFDEVTRSLPFSQRHSVAISGSSDSFSHRTVFNYESNEGLLKNNNMNKFLIKSNLTQKLFENRLIIDLNGSYSVRQYQPANEDIFYQAFIQNPTMPIYDDSNTTSGGYYQYSKMGYYNPVAMLNERQAKGRTADFVGSGRATLNIIEGLNWVNFFSYINSDWEDNRYDTRYYPSAIGNNGVARIKNGEEYKIQYETTLNYSKNIEKHTLQAMGGYSYLEEGTHESEMENSNYDVDYYFTNNMGGGAALAKGKAFMSSKKEDSKLISFFARAMYNYDDRYLLSASIRREGSSRFGDNNKWGWFPAASLGWRISKEAFMEDVKWVNDLKLRLGYGVTGNQTFGNYKSLVLMGTAGKFFYNGDWTNSYQPKTNPNPDLRWEKKTEYDLGVDFSLFKNRLSGTVDLYYRESTDLLYEYDVPVPPYLFPKFFGNVGTINNKGIEITLNGIVTQTKDFTWNTGITFSKNMNELVKFSDDQFYSSQQKTGWVSGGVNVNTQLMEVGKSLGRFYGPVWLGLDENGKDKFKNADPIGRVTENEWEDLGVAYPICNIGWSNSFTYKKVDLNFSLRSGIGGKTLNTHRLYYENWPRIGAENVIHSQYENPEFTGFAAWSSKYLEDATFLKLDNITLGYNLAFNSKYISKIRLSLSAQDVFCLTNYKGVDPEVGLGGLHPGIEPESYYPKTTSITMGVGVTF